MFGDTAKVGISSKGIPRLDRGHLYSVGLGTKNNFVLANPSQCRILNLEGMMAVGSTVIFVANDALWFVTFLIPRSYNFVRFLTY